MWVSVWMSSKCGKIISLFTKDTEKITDWLKYGYSWLHVCLELRWLKNLTKSQTKCLFVCFLLLSCNWINQNFGFLEVKMQSQEIIKLNSMDISTYFRGVKYSQVTSNHRLNNLPVYLMSAQVRYLTSTCTCK